MALWPGQESAAFKKVFLAHRVENLESNNEPIQAAFWQDGNDHTVISLNDCG